MFFDPFVWYDFKFRLPDIKRIRISWKTIRFKNVWIIGIQLHGRRSEVFHNPSGSKEVQSDYGKTKNHSNKVFGDKENLRTGKQVVDWRKLKQNQGSRAKVMTSSALSYDWWKSVIFIKVSGTALHCVRAFCLEVMNQELESKWSIKNEWSVQLWVMSL